MLGILIGKSFSPTGEGGGEEGRVRTHMKEATNEITLLYTRY